MEKRYVIQAIVASLSVLTLLVITFNKPSITGHVSANFYTQNVSIFIDHSQNFLLTSDNEKPFFINTFKLSGKVDGSGQARIYLDNGKGQKLLVYENVMPKDEGKTGFSQITASRGLAEISGNAVSEENDGKENDDKWLIIKPINLLLERETFQDLGEDKRVVSGHFDQKCLETCSISMEISRNVAYRLVFLVENGTTTKVNEVVFQTQEG